MPVFLMPLDFIRVQEEQQCRDPVSTKAVQAVEKAKFDLCLPQHERFIWENGSSPKKYKLQWLPQILPDLTWKMQSYIT